MRAIGSWFFPIILLGLWLGFGLPTLGDHPLLDTEEIRCAETAREMVLSGEYMRTTTAFKPAFEQPPLFFWLQAAAMRAFGQTEYGARLPGVLLAALGILSVFLIGIRLHNAEFGLLWAALLLSSAGVQLLWRTGVQQPASALFIFLSVNFLAFAADKKLKGGSPSRAAFAGFFLGLAFLAQGPLPVLLTLMVLAGYFIWTGGRAVLAASDALIVLLALIMTSALWFGYEWANRGPAFLSAFVDWQLQNQSIGNTASSIMPAWVVVVLLLVATFPLLPLCLPKLAGHRERETVDYRKWMVMLIWVAGMASFITGAGWLLALSLAPYAAAYLAALHMWGQQGVRVREPSRPLWAILGGGAGAIGLLYVVLPFAMQSRQRWLVPRLDGRFLQACFSASVPWPGYYAVGGLVLMLAGLLAYRAGMRRDNYRATLTLCLGSGVAGVLSALPQFYTGTAHLQGPTIAFARQTASAPSYLTTVGYRSYAPYWYGNRRPGLACNPEPDSCFTKGYVAEPAYLIIRQDQFGNGRALAGFEEISRRGGYVFFKKFGR